MGAQAAGPSGGLSAERCLLPRRHRLSGLFALWPRDAGSRGPARRAAAAGGPDQALRRPQPQSRERPLQAWRPDRLVRPPGRVHGPTPSVRVGAELLGAGGVAELSERLGLDLADALAGHAQGIADLR